MQENHPFEEYCLICKLIENDSCFFKYIYTKWINIKQRYKIVYLPLWKIAFRISVMTLAFSLMNKWSIQPYLIMKMRHA